MTTPLQDVSQDLEDLFAVDDGPLGVTHDGQLDGGQQRLGQITKATVELLMNTPGEDALDAQTMAEIAHSSFLVSVKHEKSGQLDLALRAFLQGVECLAHCIKTLEGMTGQTARYHKTNAGHTEH